MSGERSEELTNAGEQYADILNNAREKVAEEKGKSIDSDEEALNEEQFKDYLKKHSEKEDYEYLVRGAKLVCNRGSHKRMLNLPECHGVYIGENPMVHEKDCVQGIDMQGNISWFGVCRSERCQELPGKKVCYELTEENSADGTIGETEPGKKCQPIIVGVWQDVYDKTRIAESWEDEAEREKQYSTLTTGSFLVCNYGGIIQPVSSGQEYEMQEKDLGDNRDKDENDLNPQLWNEIEEARKAECEECGDLDCSLAHERHKDGEEADYGNIHGTNYFTVIFQYEDGRIIDKQHVKKGEAAKVPEELEEREGYVFAGWDKEANNVSEDTVVTTKYVLVKVDISNPEEVQRYMWEFFINAGFSEYMTAGILGNVHVETGGTFNPAIISKAGYHGLFQFGGGREKDLIDQGKKWAEASGWPETEWEKGWQDLQFQCQYALNEYEHPGGSGWLNRYFKGQINGIQIETEGTTDEFRNAQSATEAAVIFMVSYERCMILGSKVSEGGRTYYAKYQAQQDRCDRAEEYYKEYCGEDFD